MDFTDADLIDFTRDRWNHAGGREKAIRERFDLNATQFYQRVNQVLDDPKRIMALPRRLWPQVHLLDERRQSAAELRSAARRRVA